MTVLSHTIAVGHVRLERDADWQEIVAACENLESPLRCVDAATESRMKAEVERALKEGDSVGGVFEVVARGVPQDWAAMRNGTKSWTQNWRAR